MGGQTTAMGGAVDTTKSGGKPVVDSSKPFTTIRFRLHNGQSATLDVNLDNTVDVLFDYVNSVAPVKGEYQLLNGFPPKPLNNKSATIE